jgi:hypothetical protein
MRDDETLEQFRDRLLVEFLKNFGVTPDEVNLVLVGHNQSREVILSVSVY